jgi:hypothetical protein
MRDHPWVGADSAARLFGERPDPFQLGWNHVRMPETGVEFYTFISEDGGWTRTTPPDVPAQEIHVVERPLPDPTDSSVWTVAMALGRWVANRDFDAFPRERVIDVLTSIERFSASLPGSEEENHAVGAYIATAAVAMRHAARASDARAFIAPATEIVRSYLRLEIPGRVAGQALAQTLAAQCNAPQLAPPPAAPPELRANAIEHLADQTYRALKLREGKRVTPYFELTYLLDLYARTCLILGAQAVQYDAPRIGAAARPRLQRLKKLVLNSEETAAHHASSAFVLPGVFTTEELAEYADERARLNDWPLEEIVLRYSIHPALGALLVGDERPEAYKLDGAYRRRAARLADYDVLRAVAGELTPVAHANVETIRAAFS